jgi:hypothetical protein
VGSARVEAINRKQNELGCRAIDLVVGEDHEAVEAHYQWNGFDLFARRWRVMVLTNK